MTEGRPSGKDLSVEKRLVGLAGQVDRSRQDLDALGEEHTKTRQIADAGVKLAREALTQIQKVAAGATEPEEPKPPSPLLCVLHVLVDQEEELAGDLAELADWLDRVFLQYEDARLPECWAWHPAAVEELRTLHAMWLQAYRLRPAHQAVADWHDRYRPGVVRRLGELEVRLISREGNPKTLFAECLPAYHSDPARYRPRSLYGAAKLGELTDWYASGTKAAPPAPDAHDIAMAEQRLRDARS